jgi:hypothetical protein
VYISPKNCSISPFSGCAAGVSETCILSITVTLYYEKKWQGSKF